MKSTTISSPNIVNKIKIAGMEVYTPPKKMRRGLINTDNSKFLGQRNQFMVLDQMGSSVFGFDLARKHGGGNGAAWVQRLAWVQYITFELVWMVNGKHLLFYCFQPLNTLGGGRLIHQFTQWFFLHFWHLTYNRESSTGGFGVLTQGQCQMWTDSADSENQTKYWTTEYPGPALHPAC